MVEETAVQVRERFYLNYLFMTHTEEEIRRWARGLRFFRFCRPSTAPHATEGDRFLAALRFSGEDELLEIMDSLDIKIHHPPDYYPPGIHPGECRPISEFPHLEQPRYRDLNGVRTFIWIRGGVSMPGVIKLTVSELDNPFEVTERAFEGAQRVETLLCQHEERVIDPPLDSKYCVCPKYYRQFWEDELLSPQESTGEKEG